jgi:hypothetical protein
MPRVVTCRSCNNVLRVDDDLPESLTCPLCLAELERSAATPPPSEATIPVEPAGKKCPSCGAHIDSVWKYCPHCQGALHARRKRPRSRHADLDVRQDQQKTRLVLMVFGAVGGLAALDVLFAVLRRTLGLSGAVKAMALLLVAFAVLFAAAYLDQKARGGSVKFGEVISSRLVVVGMLSFVGVLCAAAFYLFVFSLCPACGWAGAHG